MAAKNQSTTSIISKPKVKRPGVHAKAKNSSNKNSKNYKKPNIGQG
jgi:hypothetical protein